MQGTDTSLFAGHQFVVPLFGNCLNYIAWLLRNTYVTITKVLHPLRVTLAKPAALFYAAGLAKQPGGAGAGRHRKSRRWNRDTQPSLGLDPKPSLDDDSVLYRGVLHQESSQLIDTGAVFIECDQGLEQFGPTVLPCHRQRGASQNLGELGDSHDKQYSDMHFPSQQRQFQTKS